MEQRQYVHRHAIDADDSPVEAVVSVVAALEDRPPLELPPLAASVDPDALDALVAGEAGPIAVAFEYLGYEVSVADGEVLLQSADGD